VNYQYLLDTNIISHLVRQPTGLIFDKISKIGEDKICTSVIVACELRFGAEKSGSIKLTLQLEKILNAIDILALKTPCEIYYAKVRHYLEQAGTPIGPNDLLIASHALALNLTVVT